MIVPVLANLLVEITYQLLSHTICKQAKSEKTGNCNLNKNTAHSQLHAKTDIKAWYIPIQMQIDDLHKTLVELQSEFGIVAKTIRNKYIHLFL